MPRRFTMAELIDRCKKRCAMENGGTVNDDSEWRELISTQWAELYSIVVESGLRYFESVQSYTTDGSASYDEPDGHLTTVGVWQVLASGERRPLRELMAQERHLFRGRTGDAVAYELIDDQIYFLPTPPSGQTYELLYVAQPTELSSYTDEQEVDVVTPDGEAFVIWGVAVAALAKEESDVSVHRAEREAARERVYNWATLRALNHNRRPYVDDMYADDPIYPGDWRWQR